MTDKLHAHFMKRDSFRIAAYMSTSKLFSSVKNNSHIANAKRSKGDEGSLLVEVLVALLVLVIVFTSAVYAISNMASQRVAVEQRDRAISLITSYEEQSRILRCGLIVDLPDSTDASVRATFFDRVRLCDFAATEYSTQPRNGGDQEFTIEEDLGNGASQTFNMSIRYWWEVPGQNVHTGNNCALLTARINSSLDNGVLPSILVRAFEVRWREKGQEFRERLVKKDPVPVDNAVFATGNRSNILVVPSTLGGPAPNNSPTNPSGNYNSTVSFQFVGGADEVRIDRFSDALFGSQQPAGCIWFPYIKPDASENRSISRANRSFFSVNPDGGAGKYRLVT